jgi:DNA mismatch repair protein MLH1
LVERREMLQEYFRLSIDENGQLLSLPQIIPNYKPDIAALATFVLRYVDRKTVHSVELIHFQF